MQTSTIRLSEIQNY